MKKDKRSELTEKIMLIKNEIGNVEFNIEISKQTLVAKRKELSEMQDKLWFLNNPDGLKITDHALIRYMERAKAFDTQKTKKEIIQELQETMGKTEGKIIDGKYFCKNFRCIVKNNEIITMY